MTGLYLEEVLASNENKTKRRKTTNETVRSKRQTKKIRFKIKIMPLV